MIRNSVLFFSVLLLTIPASGAVTAYKSWDNGLGSWDYSLTTSSLWSEPTGPGGSITHLPTGKGNFPAGNSSYHGCVEFTPPAVLYHHDYNDVIWNDAEGTIECWIAPHWNGENQGGTHPNGTLQDVIIGDGGGEWQPYGTGFNLFFFDNNYDPTPGFQMFVVFVDGDGLNIVEHYEVGNTMDWTAGSWHHVCISWDATEVMAGLDGTIFMKKARNGGFNFVNGGYLFGMHTASGPENTWDGWADDLIVEDTAYYTGLGDVNDPYIPRPGPWRPPPKAWNPTPANGVTVDKIAGSTLSWYSGCHIDIHEVYWSDDLAEVTGRTITPITLIDPLYTTTPTPSTPALGITYYWAVDLVSGTPTTYAGDLWQYTIGNYLVVDDMEDYDGSTGSSTDVPSVWADGHPTLGLDNGSAVHAIDDGFEETKQAMEYQYSNNGTSPYGPAVSKYYSEVEADTSNLDVNSDWTAEGVAWLQVNFKGQVGNDANERMYVAIEDSEPNCAIVQYGLPDSFSNPEWDEDMNNIKLTSWTSWGVDLRSFTGVDLTDVQKVDIGFGERGNITTPGGTGIVIFDEIRVVKPGLYNPSAIIPLSADVYDDGTVDLKDFAILANEYFLIEDDGMWPDW